MRIEKLEISNFRGIESGTVVFTNRTILIGDNNSGKTTILEAIALLLGRDRMVRNLSEHDFYGSTPQPGDRIRLIATLTGFEDNDPEKNVDWIRSGRGVPKWIRTSDLSVIPEPETDDDRLAVQIAFDARFDAASLEVETIRYFYDSAETGDPFDEESVSTLSGHLIRELGFFLVPASRSWDRMISFGSELFRRVINYMSGKPSETVLKIRDELRAPNPEPQADENIRDVVGAINKDLSGLLGKNTDLKLRLTHTDSHAVLNALEPHYATEGGQILPAARHGAGLVSLQSLLLLLRFGHVRAEQGDPFILAVEEPELHVPPPLQRRIAQKIHSLTSQSILTTHSPVVASHGNATDIVLVRNNAGKMTACSLAEKPLTKDSDAVARTLFQTGLNDTVSALMHSFLLVPEGRIDRDYIELMARQMTAANSDDLAESVFGTRVGVLPTKDSRMRVAFNYLQKVHGGIACLVDGDPGGDAHINELLVAPFPKVIIQWPEGWTIENAIGWIIEADDTVLRDPAIQAFAATTDVIEFVDLLSRRTNDGGMKGDLVVIETLISVASQSSPCRIRMKVLLDAILDAMTGEIREAEHLEIHPKTNDHTAVWRIVP